ncbi:MAG TPA: hypothetical protein VGO00_23050, partial [Kofleriaceae bacterium]|nr:hypothetical protein [Kofleriaceae bacterium]
MSTFSIRRHAIGVAIVLVFVLVPIAIRAMSGDGSLGIGETAFVAAVVIVVPLALVFGLRFGE